MTKPPSANDQRSNVKNPNNPAYAADQANRQSPKPGNAPPPLPAVEQPSAPKK